MKSFFAFLCVLIVCSGFLAGWYSKDYHNQQVILETQLSAPITEQQADSSSMGDIFASILFALRSIEEAIAAIQAHDILDQNDITGIVDSAHSDGSVNTTVFYKDKDGKRRSCNSNKPGVARVAGEIKIFWANGKNPNIMLDMNPTTQQINSIAILVKGPKG